MRLLRRPGRWIVQAAEAQRIHHGDGPRAHREDVAQDAADAGGRALQGLDEAGVIVRFDLEGDDVAAADIDDAGVLAGPCTTQLAARGQLLQVDARALVGAVLAPHHGEDAEFGVGGLAAQDIDHLLILAGRELMLGDDLGGEAALIRVTAAAQHRFEHDQSVGGPHQRLGGAFGMGHHAHHVAFAVEHAGDIAQRSVGVIDITERHAILGFEFVERALVGDVTAFAVGDGQAEHLALLSGGSVRASWWWLRAGAIRGR